MEERAIIKKALKKGILQIFSATFFNKIIQFGIMMFLTRVLEKSLYGKLSYAQTILNIFLVLDGLGMASSFLQYGSMQKMEDKKLSYFKYSVKIGSVFNALIALAIIIYTRFFVLPVKGSTEILFYFALIPIMTIFFNEIQMLLRAEFKNTQYSILTVVNTALYFIGNVTLGKYFSIKGIVAGRYIAYIVSIVVGIYMIRNQLKKFRIIKYPEIGEKKDFLKYSIVTCFTNATSQLLIMLDSFFVGLLIPNSSVVASYTVSAVIPTNLTFIPIAIMTFVYPYFARHWNDKKWIKDQYSIFIKYLFILNMAITLVLVIFAPYIVETVFTKQYSDAVTNFRILSIGYFIAGTFKIPAGNTLASMKFVKANFYNSAITGVIYIILNVVLISKFGSIGASISTVLIYGLSSIMFSVYIRKVLK
ncbi:oligosaccharide flippase family protein [Clostridium tyrobutyricum]|uniref:oligosaccharide flippase family protein n=1 Tax=Clostridium tyrobutyricum TaxID=1519 RepID=UPI001C38012D|nr:oligosaccharide flippase family protein [Clostridium tyrobutyricum]MBV4430947.1 oligosaccharide flippase family protein [Clostridium tyrobutyricum]